MTLAKTLLAIALPFALSAGCALDVGSSADGLAIETNSNVGTNLCGQTSQQWLDDDARWPVDTIVAGDMEFTKDGLVSFVRTHPEPRTGLIAEMAAVQLNMAIGLVIPDDILIDLVDADGRVMAPDDGDIPPPIAIDDFESLRNYNSIVARDCFSYNADVAQVTPGVRDLRENLVADD